MAQAQVKSSGKKHLMKKAEKTVAPELMVAEKITAQLNRVHMRIRKY